MRKKFMRGLRRTWNTLRNIGAVWTLLQLLGLVPVMLGVFTAILAFLESLPPLYIFLALLGGYTIGITAVNQGAAWRQRKKINQGQIAPVRERKPERIEHDGVLWEYTGGYYSWTGDLLAEGPLCPKDYCLLSLRSHGLGGVHEEVRADNHDDQIISESHYHAILFCQECKEQYTLGEEEKTIRQSRQEVETLFEAKHRRETNAKEI